ncbi:MAG: hypothetical protein CMQ49_09865 [Gammaproteobacteria bacterium]|nr:hypothetical protein [Gammaproteobacteria bacterium]
MPPQGFDALARALMAAIYRQPHTILASLHRFPASQAQCGALLFSAVTATAAEFSGNVADDAGLLWYNYPEHDVDPAMAHVEIYGGVSLLGGTLRMAYFPAYFAATWVSTASTTALLCPRPLSTLVWLGSEPILTRGECFAGTALCNDTAVFSVSKSL